MLNEFLLLTFSFRHCVILLNPTPRKMFCALLLFFFFLSPPYLCFCCWDSVVNSLISPCWSSKVFSQVCGALFDVSTRLPEEQTDPHLSGGTCYHQNTTARSTLRYISYFLIPSSVLISSVLYFSPSWPSHSIHQVSQGERSPSSSKTMPVFYRPASRFLSFFQHFGLGAFLDVMLSAYPPLTSSGNHQRVLNVSASELFICIFSTQNCVCVVGLKL